MQSRVIMAFVKRNYFAFEQKEEKTPENKQDDSKISIPLVFTRENGKIHGFVPGIVMKDIVHEEIAQCEQDLKEHVKKFVIKTRNEKASFPFFPTNEQIKRDFKHVVLINRFNIQNKK